MKVSKPFAPPLREEVPSREPETERVREGGRVPKPPEPTKPEAIPVSISPEVERKAAPVSQPPVVVVEEEVRIEKHEIGVERKQRRGAVWYPPTTTPVTSSGMTIPIEVHGERKTSIPISSTSPPIPPQEKKRSPPPDSRSVYDRSKYETQSHMPPASRSPRSMPSPKEPTETFKEERKRGH